MLTGNVKKYKKKNELQQEDAFIISPVVT